MQKQDLMILIAYSNWATDVILHTAAQLSPEQFIAPVIPNPGWSSVRGTLVHTLNAEVCWRSRLQHGRDALDLAEAEFPDVAAVVARWDEERRAWQHYLASLEDEQLNGTYAYSDRINPNRKNTFCRWHTVLHVFNHGTQHRAEVAAMLTSYGHSPGELDFDIFDHEHPSGLE